MQLPAHVKAAIKSGHVPKLRNWRKLKPESLTRGERVCSFIETACVIPEGSLVGQPVVLDVFQVAFVLAVYDNPATTKAAILSMSRKNAKTALIAFLLLAHVVGPEATINSRYNSGAMSRQQASEVYNYAAKSAMLSPLLRDLVRTIPSQKTIVGLPLNTEYRALSADASTNIGGSPAVAILDEVGQIKGAHSDFVDAVTTAQAAHDNPLLFYISTQAPTDADFLSILIDDATINKPPQVVCHVYQADKDCDVMDERQWLKANPALGKFRSIDDMRAQAEKAERMPSFRNTFRNLLLNQRIASFATFIDPDQWRECGGALADFSQCVQVFGGLDLSAKNDLTAFVLVGIDGDGRVNAQAKFWTPRQGLRDRQQTDRAPYDLWEQQGWLTVVEGAVIDYDVVLHDISAWLDDLGVMPDAIAFDRWRIDLFRKAMDAAGVELPLVEFGQGYKDMAPALDALEDAVMQGRLVHDNNPVLNMCAVNAVAVSDPANNRKLEKRKATGRIDGMVALAMAIGARDKAEDTGIGDLTTFFSAPIVL